MDDATPPQVELPIAAFPPFKLRSSMVDKDPVIWVHLIEVYIKYVQTILTIKLPLTARSEQQLCLFVKSYLHEIAEEQGQILSLGLINPQITANLDILRAWIFELVKQIGVLNLKLNGEALWDLAKIYAIKNSAIVRGIINGSYKPRDKKTISSISLVQKHIENLIGNGKFDNKVDLQVLAALLNERSKAATNKPTGAKPIKRNKTKDELFVDQFVTVSWFEMLEKLYAKGEGRFHKICVKIGILSLTQCSIQRIATLATELGISSYHSLSLYPLFAGIVTNQNFKNFNPGLDRKLPFLVHHQQQQQHSSNHKIDSGHVKTLIDMFPALTISHTETLLRKHNNDVESVTHLLLENPDAANPEEDDSSSSFSARHSSNPVSADSIITKKKVISRNNQYSNHVPDEHRNRTLTAALKLIYEADEDEHDDTYDEAEAAVSSLAGGDQSKYDKIEKYLWELFKKDQSIFDKSQRKSRIRKEMKDETKWSDEQIEGWSRMLQKSPKRAKIMEEKYMFRGNKPYRSSFRREKEEELEISEENNNTSRSNTPIPDKTKVNKTNEQTKKPNEANKNSIKKQQNKNEKQKSSRANHNRKSGHDKKMSKGFV